MEKRGRKKSGGSIRGKRRYKRNTKESLKRDLANAFADCMQPVAPSRTHQSKLLRYARRYSSPLGASKRSSRRSAREISKGRPKSRGKTKKGPQTTARNFLEKPIFIFSFRRFTPRCGKTLEESSEFCADFTRIYYLFLEKIVQGTMLKRFLFVILGVCFLSFSANQGDDTF